MTQNDIQLEPGLATWDEFKLLSDFEDAIGDGAAFGNDGLQRKNGNIVPKPPVQNILVAAVLWPILVTPKYRQQNLWGVVLPQVAGAVLAVAAQAIAIFYTLEHVMKHGSELDAEESERCYTGGACSLRVVCVLTLLAQIGGEIGDTRQFYLWIARLPPWDDTDEVVLESLQSGFAVRRLMLHGRGGVEFNVAHIAAGGVTPNYRDIMYLVCSIKLLVEAATSICGSGYVLYANSNEELLLNSLALFFILEIDDTMYRYLLSDVLKRFIENEAPEIGLVRGNPSEVGQQHAIHEYASQTNSHLQVAGLWLRVLLLGFAVGGAWLFWC
jgi:hypothetical protein